MGRDEAGEKQNRNRAEQPGLRNDKAKLHWLHTADLKREEAGLNGPVSLQANARSRHQVWTERGQHQRGLPLITASSSYGRCISRNVVNINEACFG